MLLHQKCNIYNIIRLSAKAQSVTAAYVRARERPEAIFRITFKPPLATNLLRRSSNNSQRAAKAII